MGTMKRLVLTAFTSLVVLGCSAGRGETAPEDKGKLVFSDSFDRAEIGPDWNDTGGGYRIVNGELRAQGARNKPLWLKKKLPRNARVEFTAHSESEAVDIKVELWGDGVSRAIKASYTATSYVVILGGWNNSRSIIARMDEHGDDRKVRTEPRGVPGKRYRFSVVRMGDVISWLLDGEKFLEMDDEEPLFGPGHEHFAINNWASEVFFDDLVIYEI
jgi:hypothetical protein